jgi:hypothetical protein
MAQAQADTDDVGDVEIISMLDFSGIEVFEPDELIDIGLSNSKKNRKEIYNFLKRRAIDHRSFTTVMCLSGVIKNRNRLLRDIPTGEAYIGVRNLLTMIPQYNSEIGSSPCNIAFINFPNAFPEIAIVGRFYTYKDQLLAMDQVPSVLPEFLQATFIGGLDLDASVQELHKEWERNFWDTTVRRSRNPDKEAYEAGFHEEYYANRAGDKYKLFLPSLKKVDGPYNMRKICEVAKQWAKSFTN